MLHNQALSNTGETMPLEAQWTQIHQAFGAAFASSFHYSIATVSPNGMPHVAPIGSILLLEPGRGIYFEEFPKRMPSHFEENSNVCVLGVNSSRWYWLGALLRGRFEKPPAVRLSMSSGLISVLAIGFTSARTETGW